MGAEEITTRKGARRQPDDAIRAAIAQCRRSGRSGDHAAVIESADNALRILRGKASDRTAEDQLEARILGYKGYALVQLGDFDSAEPLLEQSLELRRRRGNLGTAGESEREDREVLAAERALGKCQQNDRQQSADATLQSLPKVTKYPRTAHLFDTGGTATTEDDLVLPLDDPSLLTMCDGSTNVVIEDKIDGANLGVSLLPSGEILVQNRSHYICWCEHPQFSRIPEWVEEHRLALIDVLSPRDSGDKVGRDGFILYGEWVAARHSVPYARLPGWFVAFDLYDRALNRFLSRARFHRQLRGTGIPVVPVIETRTFGPYPRLNSMTNLSAKHRKTGMGKQPDGFRDVLCSLLSTMSAFRNDDGPVEGIVLRVDGGKANEEVSEEKDPLWLEHRFKIVRPDFIRGCSDGHWSKRKIEKQRIDPEYAEKYLRQCYTFADGTPIDTSGEGSDESEAPKVGNEKKDRQAQRETSDAARHLERLRRRSPRVIILMGLPASGKSTFAAALSSGLSAPGRPCVIANQDKLGRKECERVAGRADARSRVIVDRCNLTQAERDEWLQICHDPPKGEVALMYLATDPEMCVHRAGMRVGHETIPFGGGERIIRGLAKRLEEPGKRDYERFGSVHVVRSAEEGAAVLRQWGVEPPVAYQLDHDKE